MISTEHDLRNHMNAAIRVYIDLDLRLFCGIALRVSCLFERQKRVDFTFIVFFDHASGSYTCFVEFRPYTNDPASDQGQATIVSSARQKLTVRPPGAVTTVSSRTRRRVRVHCSRQYCCTYCGFVQNLARILYRSQSTCGRSRRFAACPLDVTAARINAVEPHSLLPLKY